jgi:CspA family cold shock protein
LYREFCAPPAFCCVIGGGTGPPGPVLSSGDTPQARCNGRILLLFVAVSTFGRIIGPFCLALRRALVQNLPNIDHPGDEPRGSAALNPSADPSANPSVHLEHESSRSNLSQQEDISVINGTVKFYNSQKGFGFIQPDDGSKDVFVHVTALERAGLRGLNEGQKVAFDTQPDRKTGKIAVGNIQVL